MDIAEKALGIMICVGWFVIWLFNITPHCTC